MINIKQRKIKIEPRIKFNYKMYIVIAQPDIIGWSSFPGLKEEKKYSVPLLKPFLSRSETCYHVVCFCVTVWMLQSGSNFDCEILMFDHSNESYWA